MCFISYFVFFCRLFICKPKLIDYLGWGRDSLFVCCCLLVIMWFLFGEVFSSSGFLGWATLFLWHSLSLPYNYFGLLSGHFFVKELLTRLFKYVHFEAISMFSLYFDYL